MARFLPRLLFSILLINSILADDTLAKLERGVEIQGFRMATINNNEFSAFLGIQYAESPEGKLRFQPPVPKVWSDGETVDATKYCPECPQINYRKTDEMSGQEDCLVLNVFSHNTSLPLRKVMVFIHGGGFDQGAGNDVGPRRLLDRDVVLVTINYRLGALGFLSTMDEASPGNYALLDQREALKWVQRNIRAFGGNPNKVTIFGVSAGSTSVFDHYISPLSSGLFHRAIAQSDNVYRSYAEYCNPMRWTKLLANSVGCLRANTGEIVECLRQTPVEKLIQASDILYTAGVTQFVPVNDGYFFSDLPSELFRKGQIANPVPLMFGITKDEGLTTAILYAWGWKEVSNKMIAAIVGGCFNLESQTIPLDVVELVRKQYFEPLESTNDTKKLRAVLDELVTDIIGFSPFIEAAQTLIQYGIKPFMYSFDYVTNYSISQLYEVNETLGVAHGDDQGFLFDSDIYFPSAQNKSNDKTEDKFLDIWISFAENGVPSEVTPNGKIAWKPTQPDQINIYHLNRKITLEQYQPADDWRIDFWQRKIPALLNTGQCKKKKICKLD